MAQFSFLAIGVFYGRIPASSGKGPVEENERMTKMDKAVVFRLDERQRYRREKERRKQEAKLSPKQG